MTPPRSSPPVAVLRKKLSSLRPTRNCGLGMVSWELSADCRFWASLTVNSLTHIPLVGICLPTVMDRVDLLFQRTAVQYDKPVDRTCSPVFAIPLDALMDRYLPERTTPLPDFGSLHVRAPLSSEAAQAMIEALLQAESVLIRVAGDLRSFVDWSSQTFQNHPGLEFSLPVACRLLGEDAEAKSYIDAYRARIQATGNRGYSDLYERYIEELARDFSAGA